MPSIAPLTAPAPIGHTGNPLPFILLVDDDPGIRHFIGAVLDYQTSAIVMEASGAAEALFIARNAGRPVDLLISDIHLSLTTNGIDLARRLSAEGPTMKVMLISGSDSPPRDLPGSWRFLSKPFAIAEFLECVAALCRPAGVRL